VIIHGGSKIAQHEGSVVNRADKYGQTIIGETIMPDLSEPEEFQKSSPVHQETDDGWLFEQRELLRVSLPGIASRARAALDEAALAVEVFFTVPMDGDALLNFATPTDPSDPDWAQANQIVCNTIANITGIEGLRSRCISSATSDIP
jgi:hypothetical protein